MEYLGIALVLLALLAAGMFMLVPAFAYAVGMFAERRLAGLRRRAVEVAGHEICFLEGGKGDAVILLHGFGADKDNWTRFARALTKHYRVIAPDLPGFGESTRDGNARYDAQSQAERVVAFAAALGVQRFHLAGNSMGGHIAALCAVRYPDAVQSLGLFDNAGIDTPGKTEFFAALDAGRNLLLTESVADFDRLMAFLFVRIPWMPRPVLRHLGALATRYREFNARIFDQYRDGYAPLEPVLGSVTAPTLMLWGDQDRVLDIASIDIMRPLLPRSHTVVMKDCGHLPMVERPAETASHYRAFLAQTA